MIDGSVTLVLIGSAIQAVPAATRIATRLHLRSRMIVAAAPLQSLPLPPPAADVDELLDRLS